MKKEEADTLIIKKSKEGKTPKQIAEELSLVNNSTKEIKSQVKEIIRLNKLLEKKDKELNKLKKENFDLKFKEDIKND